MNPILNTQEKKNNGELEAIRAKRRKEALWMKALEHEAREKKAFESSLSYRFLNS